MTLLEMAGDFYLPNGGPLWMRLRRNNFPSSQLKGSKLRLNFYHHYCLSTTEAGTLLITH